MNPVNTVLIDGHIGGIIKGGIHDHILVRRCGLIRNSRRAGGCRLVNVGDLITGDSRIIPGFILTAEINRAVGCKFNTCGVTVPDFAVKAVFIHNGITAEYRAHGDGLIGGSRLVCGSCRCIRRDRVNVADLISSHFRPVARFILTAETDRTVGGEFDTCGVTVPDFAVKTVFFHHGITAESRAHRDFLIGHGGDICGNSRCIRRDSVNIADLITGHF